MEVELEKSKQARREQTDEFEAQIKEIASAHERELKSVRQSFEDERLSLNTCAQQQRDTIMSNYKQVSGVVSSHTHRRKNGH